MIRAMTIIRVSAEDQLRGYGPDVQWYEDVLPAAPVLGLEVEEGLRRVIQEPATKWDREKFEGAVREAQSLYAKGSIGALLFPRVDRETRFLFGSFPLLAEVVRTGLKVYFARERLFLDAKDPESVERYLTKATQAQAYVETMRQNTMRGRRQRALQDHKLPNGQVRWPFDYDSATGRARPNPERAAWVRKWTAWLLEEGMSLGVVCQRMEQARVPSPRGSSKWSRCTLTRILKDQQLLGEFYAWKGDTPAQKTSAGQTSECKRELVYKSEGEAILSREQFEAVQARLRANIANSPRHVKHSYPPLRGMVFCRCGRKMGGVTHRVNKQYYRCNGCRKPMLPAWKLWENLRGSLKDLILNPDRLIPAVRSHLESGASAAELEKQLQLKRTELARWEQAEDKAVRMHLVLTDYPAERLQQRLAEIKVSKTEVAKEIPDLERQLDAARNAEVDEEGIRGFCEMASRQINELTDAQWRMILEKLRVRIIVRDRGTCVVQMAISPAKREIALQAS